ncbi:MAG: hypothetical protein GYB68_06300 [Chloroflexi bacterium]|nr:hypothetical protein [Chloroflexota bacterium]
MGAQSIVAVSRHPRSRDVISYDDLRSTTLQKQGSLIVNCTPVGMSPQVEASPWPADLPCPDQVTLYDLVYNPPETTFMRQVRAVGGRAISGLGMLVRQGAAAFKLWTGLTPPLDVMTDATKQQLMMQKD